MKATSNAEMLVCELYPCNGNKLTVCLCYRPPSCTEFLDQFGALLYNLQGVANRICILGDFNMPNINWNLVTDCQNSSFANDFCNLINYNFLTQKVCEPTRVFKDSQSILDLIFSNYPDEICNVNVDSDVLSSDHFVVSFTLLT